MLLTVDKFTVIVITEAESPLTAEQEAGRIATLLISGAADRVHLRCPDDRARICRLMELLPRSLRERLTVHHFPDVARKYGVAYHLRDGEEAPGDLRVSRSLHRLGADSAGCDYTFLSPVYPSVSKPGYLPSFTLAEASRNLPGGRVIALGGVTPRRFPQLAAAGFSGAALLGYVWRQAADDAAFAGMIEELKRMRRAIGAVRLQFITSAPDAQSTALQAIEAIKWGCRWVQVRMKDSTDDEVEQAVRLIAPHAERGGAILIVDDRVELAARMREIDGVHLGLTDMPREDARRLLGESKIIGSTANTPAQALRYAPLSDYLGVGPFRFTQTKKNLAPLLGSSGIVQIMEELRDADFYIPVVAIGGIGFDDLDDVMRSGVTGVALSGAITGAPDPARMTNEIINKLTRYND